MYLEWQGRVPVVADDAFVAPTAVLIGDVTVGPGASVWFGAVLRADFGSIVVHRGANVQDNVVIHVDADHPTIVGENATVGHGSVLEGCTIERGAVIGMNAVVMIGVHVGEEAMIAAGAVIPEGMEIPPRHLAAGVPATVKKELSGRSLEWVGMAAKDYHDLTRTYLEQPSGGSAPDRGRDD